MKDHIKKEQGNETIIDGGKVYDELRKIILIDASFFLLR
jgi:hypothetical protein